MEDRLANISLKDESKGSSDLEQDSTDERNKFMALVKKSRQLAENGNIAKALSLNKKALAIHYTEKLEKRIKKMEAFLAQQGSSSDEDILDENKEDLEDLGFGFKLHCSMSGKLYPHQREGVLWLWSLYRKKKGGILADDMGLGKTIQVIAFLAGMFDMQLVHSVMIVLPLSVMPTWQTEFEKWTPGINVTIFHGSSLKERERALNRVRSKGGVMLTTYGLIVTQTQTLSERYHQEFVWDYIILDEGHKIKNRTKTSKGINIIPAKNRIILTGTPVQNNLKELWSLFDYVHQGSLLGTARTFKMEFETPIIKARERDASAVEKRLGQQMADALKRIIQPYFLRRTKKEVSKIKHDMDGKCVKMPELTRKNDFVVWTFLSEAQQKIYQDFSNLDEIKELLMTKKSPLVALTVLKKICDHPRLLSTKACLKLGLDGDDFDEEELEQAGANESAANQVDKIPDELLISEAGKMTVLVELLDNFKAGGHKTLVFSQSRKQLDIIQKVITNRGQKVARLDGKISALEERKHIVNKFQKDPSYSVFLLTIQVGGVGLTITAADRVIIYDPSWNPAVDAQAVDRAYRIGQTENVVVHRLITCGTVEEKIYRRQVFKDSITRQTTGNAKNPYRYFTRMELHELFTLDDPHDCKTQRQLAQMHANQRISDESLDHHIAFLYSLDIFGISDHDLMFNQTSSRDDEEEAPIGAQEHDYNEQFIKYKIAVAQQLIAEESTNELTYDQRVAGIPKIFTGGIRTDIPRHGTSSELFTNVLPPSMDEDPVVLSDEEESGSHNVQDSYRDPTPSTSSEVMCIEDSYTDQKDENSERDIKPKIEHNGLETENAGALDIDSIKKEEENIGSAVKNEAEERKTTDVGKIKDSSVNEHHSEFDINAEDEEICSEGPSVEIYEDDDLDGENKSSNDIRNRTMNCSSQSLLDKSKSELHQRILQLLTKEELDNRSPIAMNDKSRIIAEEIIISPNYNQPIVGLGANPNKSGCSQIFQSPVLGSVSKLSVCSPARFGSTVKRQLDLGSRSVLPSSPSSRNSSICSDKDVLATESPQMSKHSNLHESLSFIAASDDEAPLVKDKDNDNVIEESYDDGSYGQSVDEENSEVEEDNDDDSHDEDSDEEDKQSDDEQNVDDEENEKFQELVMIARTLYKKKDYATSLLYVQEALAIFPEPDLQSMEDKIKSKIEQQTLNETPF